MGLSFSGGNKSNMFRYILLMGRILYVVFPLVRGEEGIGFVDRREGFHEDNLASDLSIRIMKSREKLDEPFLLLIVLENSQ